LDETRKKRVESQVRDEISKMIMKGEVKDPRISPLLSLTGVTVSADLNYAKVRVSAVSEDISLENSVEALNHAAGHIQKLLGRRVRFRFVPKLTFVADTSIRDGFLLNQKIEEIVPETDET